MKKFYLVLSGIFALFGLIISFENVLMEAPVIFLFKTINKSLFFSLFAMFLIGLACGFFLALSAGDNSDRKSDDF